MTVTELVQLYAPLAGLLGVVFWLGVLSEKVKNLQRAVETLERELGDGGGGERLVRLEVQMTSVADQLKGIHRSMDGVQRQLGNLMKPGVNQTFTMEGGHS
jgi:hypothetical protein